MAGSKSVRSRSAWAAILAGGLVLWARVGMAAVASTGSFGIDIDVDFPFTSGTFDGGITSFNAGPFSVGGTPVDLAGNVGSMTIANGNIPAINIPALAATFDFDAVSAPLSFEGAGVAVCSTNIVACAAGQASFVGDISNITDPGNLLPDGWVYTFDGTAGDNPGSGFDAIGQFGINAFLPVDVPAGNPVAATSDPTTFFDSRSNVFRDFLIDVTFAEVSVPGTIAFLGKSALPGALPANIAVQPDVSVFVDIVTGGGLAFTPPVDVCVHYDDADLDGIVDGTSVSVENLKLLHAAALGDNFQDVTTSVGGGELCGQVGSLSPFLVATGPPLTTTSTSIVTTSTTVVSTTTTSTSSTTSTSIIGLVPGGKTTAADCYLELAVVNVVNDGTQVVDNKTVNCTDGAACDSDGPCNDTCTLQVAACINQNDPNVADCTPPAGLDSASIKGKVTVAVPQLLEGSACGSFLDLPVTVKFNKKGTYLAKKSKQKLKGKAKAPKGTKPRTDSDAWSFVCAPDDSCPQ